jgi:hypothetical protein
MRRFLVSSFLADVTQQIHSFRARGVISAQRLFAATSDARALRKSGGSLWIAPPAIALESVALIVPPPFPIAMIGIRRQLKAVSAYGALIAVEHDIRQCASLKRRANSLLFRDGSIDNYNRRESTSIDLFCGNTKRVHQVGP